MTTLLGFAFLTGGAGIFALAFVTILMYLIVAPLERRELREHYGAEYEHYTRRVPRFLPHLRRNSWGSEIIANLPAPDRIRTRKGSLNWRLPCAICLE